MAVGLVLIVTIWVLADVYYAKAPEQCSEQALLTGLPLTRASQWYDKRADDLAKDLREFVKASIDRDTEIKNAAFARSRLLGLASLVASLVLLMVTTFALIQYRSANSNAVMAQANAVRAQEANAAAEQSAAEADQNAARAQANETRAVAALSRAAADEGRALDGTELALVAWPRGRSLTTQPMLESTLPDWPRLSLSDRRSK